MNHTGCNLTLAAGGPNLLIGYVSVIIVVGSYTIQLHIDAILLQVITSMEDVLTLMQYCYNNVTIIVTIM